VGRHTLLPGCPKPGRMLTQYQGDGLERKGQLPDGVRVESFGENARGPIGVHGTATHRAGKTTLVGIRRFLQTTCQAMTPALLENGQQFDHRSLEFG